MNRWEHFGKDYPEIMGYLLGQVSHKFVADHRVMDLITLVNSIPCEDKDDPQVDETITLESDTGEYTVHEFEHATDGVFPSHEIRNSQGDVVIYGDKHRAPVYASVLNKETAALRQHLANEQARVSALEAELQKAQAHIGQILPANLSFASSVLEYQRVIEDLRKQLSREIEAHHNDVDELRSEIAMHETLVPQSTPDAQEPETILRRELNATLRVIREAYARLNDSRIKDYDKVSLAAEILEPYTEPKE